MFITFQSQAFPLLSVSHVQINSRLEAPLCHIYMNRKNSQPLLASQQAQYRRLIKHAPKTGPARLLANRQTSTCDGEALATYAMYCENIQTAQLAYRYCLPLLPPFDGF